MIKVLVELWAPGHWVPEVLAGSPLSASLRWVVGARPGCSCGGAGDGDGENPEKAPLLCTI